MNTVVSFCFIHGKLELFFECYLFLQVSDLIYLQVVYN